MFQIKLHRTSAAREQVDNLLEIETLVLVQLIKKYKTHFFVKRLEIIVGYLLLWRVVKDKFASIAEQGGDVGGRKQGSLRHRFLLILFKLLIDFLLKLNQCRRK